MHFGYFSDLIDYRIWNVDTNQSIYFVDGVCVAGVCCYKYGDIWSETGKYDGRKVTTYTTTHQWYVVLEVICVGVCR